MNKKSKYILSFQDQFQYRDQNHQAQFSILDQLKGCPHNLNHQDNHSPAFLSLNLEDLDRSKDTYRLKRQVQIASDSCCNTYFWVIIWLKIFTPQDDEEVFFEDLQLKHHDRSKRQKNKKNKSAKKSNNSKLNKRKTGEWYS